MADTGLCDGIWTFKGRDGKAEWPQHNNAKAELTVEHLDSKSITIVRVETSTPGFTAIYTGEIKGGRVSGTVTWNWDRHGPPTHGVWSATIGEPMVEASASQKVTAAVPVKAVVAAGTPVEPKTEVGGGVLPSQRVTANSPNSARSVVESGKHPDLRGLWQVYNAGLSRPPTASFNIDQSGENVTMQFYPYQKSELTMYEGKFESDTSIAGKGLQQSSLPDNPRWLPAKMTLIDGDHLKLSWGPTMIRATASQSKRFQLLRKYSMTPLPATLLNLTGQWALESEAVVTLRQENGEIALIAGSESIPSFSGKYVSNPEILGQGIADGSTRDNIKYVEQRLTILNPDHLQLDNIVLSRASPPAIHDVPCDDQNSYHVSDYYAWARGRINMGQKDYKTGVCWLTISTNWGFIPAQSALAVILKDGVGDIRPDYKKAFELAQNSANEGDIVGQTLLSKMYLAGQGTAPDAQKAAYWQEKAKQRQSEQNWALWTTKGPLGVSPLEAAGSVLGFFADSNDREQQLGDLMRQGRTRQQAKDELDQQAAEANALKGLIAPNKP
jgi:hypothetical protein